MLLLSKDDDSPIKIIDFGYAAKFAEVRDGNLVRNQLIGKVGSVRLSSMLFLQPYYTSPDIFKGQYTELCDTWSLGVILYILLSGMPPFYGNSDG